MNVLPVVERLAADKRAAVQLDPERCRHASDTQSASAACGNLWPAGAISVATPPTHYESKCLDWLTCLPACPVGAYTADEAVAGVFECAARADESNFELTYERHPLEGRGLVGEAVGRHVDERMAQARQLLERSGRAGAMTCQAAFDQAPRPRQVIDRQNPAGSRRDLFRTLSRRGQLAAAYAVWAGEPEARGPAPGRDRRRLARALAHLSSEAIPGQPGPGERVRKGAAARPVERFGGECADRRDDRFGSGLSAAFRGNLRQPVVRQ